MVLGESEGFGSVLATLASAIGFGFATNRTVVLAPEPGGILRKVRRKVGDRPSQEWLSKTATVRCTLG